jgi:sirohydrochlorin ferrochelatase
VTPSLVRVAADSPVRAGEAPLVLAAHGSRDARSARTMRELAAGVGQRWGGEVRAAFLEFNPPSVAEALHAVPSPAVVVPMLLTRAYHSRVDVPGAVAASGRPAVVVAPVLGLASADEAPDPLLTAALLRRLSELDTRYDGVVLAAAGTSYAEARSTVERIASTVDSRCLVGYATTSKPSVYEAVLALRATGARRVAVASYFLAPGMLHDVALQQAETAGAVAVAGPLGTAEELVELIVQRALSAPPTR